MPAFNKDQQQSEFWKLKINKENDTPYFYQIEKKNDAWVEVATYTNMKGQLLNITTKTYQWEGKDKQAIEFTLLHETGVKMIVSASFSNMTRSLLNSLAGCDSIGVLELQATRWGKKGADKKYPTVFVQNNGQKTTWKFQMNEIPQVEAIKNKKGETVSIYDTDCNEFFKLVIQNDILPKIHVAEQVVKEMAKPQAASSGKGKTTEQAPDPIDNLPF